MIAEALEIIAKTPIDEYASGCKASFISINEQWGLKWFYNEMTRDRTYRLQSIAADNGFGPALGEKFESKDQHGCPIYGYITEKIEILMMELYNGYGSCYQEDLTEVVPGFNDFIEKCESFMVVYDIHNENCGYMPDGRLVIIDFDQCREKQ